MCEVAAEFVTVQQDEFAGSSMWEEREGKWVRLSPAEMRAAREKAKAEHAAHLAAKGHDCWDNAKHGYDPKSALGDYYTCALCGDLLQVG